MSETKIKVLIVDDSAIARGIFEKAFKSTTAFEVVGMVSNGRKAVDFCHANEVQLVVTDYDMPTSGTAKFSSPLSVDDFIKKTQYTYYTADALKRVAEDVACFARKEGLTGHAKSAVIRLEDDEA